MNNPMMSGENKMNRRGTIKLAYLGLMAAMLIVLGILESWLPPPPVAVPLRYGLANLVVMFALCFLPKSYSIYLAATKVLIALIWRGPVAAALSLGGTVFAWVGVSLLLRLPPRRVSYFFLCISSAFLHNLGQLTVLSLLPLGVTVGIIYPYLIVISLLAGALNAALFRVLLPFWRRAVSSK